MAKRGGRIEGGTPSEDREEPETGPTAAPAGEVRAEAGVEHPGGDPDTLLDRLLYKGVLPRYAFPTDVATFYVFDAANSRGPIPAFQFSPSQGLAIALSQYAPGKEVWIANKCYTSGAIYSPMRGDRALAWQRKRLYYECRHCHFAEARDISRGHRGEQLDCPACATQGVFGPARSWLRPPGFAHPVDLKEETSPDDQPARSYATRAKLAAPAPLDGAEWNVITERVRWHYMRDKLLVTNSGPRHEGYSYCTTCGRIEPSAVTHGLLSGPHPKPFPDDRAQTCTNGHVAREVVLGMDFITDILLLSVRVDDPVHLAPGYLPTEIALRTVSEALARAACEVLGLEQGEVQADFRAALTSAGQSGLEAEVYLYDTLPGGAGNPRSAGHRSVEILETALRTLKECDCDASCYKCLRSFKNKFEHDRLDRELGASLLDYLLHGTAPTLTAKRTERAHEILAEDIGRQGGARLTVQRDALVEVPTFGEIIVPILVTGTTGQQRAICVTHPLTAATPPNPSLAALADFSPIVVVPLHELRVRRSLPSVTSGILADLGIAE